MKRTLFFLGWVIYFVASAQKSAPTFIGLNEAPNGSLWLSGTQSSFQFLETQQSNWQKLRFAPIDSLQFRDVHAFNTDSCLLLSAGSWALSRIYSYSKTSGFQLRYTMPYTHGFLNAMALNNKGLGYAYGDAINNHPFILETRNYGQTWQRIDTLFLPSAGAGEGGFASSGTCVTLSPKGYFLIGTGSNGNARLLLKEPKSPNWQPIETPMPKGDFAGITTVQALDSLWFIGGGNISDSAKQNTAFVSFSKGKTWQTLSPRPSPGPIYGSALAYYKEAYVLVVCGPSGADLSFDLGKTWQTISTKNIWTCLISSTNELWLAGKNGFIKRLHLRELQEK